MFDWHASWDETPDVGRVVRAHVIAERNGVRQSLIVELPFWGKWIEAITDPAGDEHTVCVIGWRYA